MNKKIAAYVAEYLDLIITVAPAGFSLLAFLLFFVDMKKKKKSQTKAIILSVSGHLKMYLG